MKDLEHSFDNGFGSGCRIFNSEGPTGDSAVENMRNRRAEIGDESIDDRPAIARGDLADLEHLEVVDHHRDRVAHDREIELAEQALGRVFRAIPLGDHPSHIADPVQMTLNHRLVELAPVLEGPVDIGLGHTEPFGDIGYGRLLETDGSEQLFGRIKNLSSAIDGRASAWTQAFGGFFFFQGTFHDETCKI